jgi:hypothetical protein
MAYLQADGSMLRPCQVAGGSFNGGGRGGRVQAFDPTGTLTWDWTHATTQFQLHHDIAPMPNGNILMISWELKTQQEAIDAGRINPTGAMWPDKIIEVQPVGSNDAIIVWEWHFWDHLIQEADPAQDNFGVVADHPELLDVNFGGAIGGDWNHCNSIDYNPELDHIVISSRSFDEFYVIDHSTTTEEAAGHTAGNSGMGGDFLFRWGNSQVYDRGGAPDRIFNVLHGVNWVDCGLPGAGNILAFNNGDRPGTANDYSTAVEITPPYDGSGGYLIDPGQAFGPAAATWSYGDPGDFYAGPTYSGAFRLANGNTLITSNTNGLSFEVTSSGSTVWSYDHPSSVPRMPRYWQLPGGDYWGPGIYSPDTDNDGVCDAADLCPLDNPDDSDLDGVCDSDDNCVDLANPDQLDCDDDDIGDACVLADDPILDCNGNGIPDSCDIDDGTSPDVDGDGIPDECVDPCLLGDCADPNTDGVRDDNCVWAECLTGPGTCLFVDIVFGDMGGPFGDCPSDGFANIHDKTHALTCFSGISPCNTINIDAGGSFGACAADGFCNIHDANHALTAFAGTNSCSCPSDPSPQMPVTVVGGAALRLEFVPQKRNNTYAVRAFIDGPIDALRSYQLEILVSGGRTGELVLDDIIIEPHAAAVFDQRNDSFFAHNTLTAQTLGGIDGQDGVVVEDSAYLATFIFSRSRSAEGTFVIDVLASLGAQTFLVAPQNGMIEIERTVPATVEIGTRRRTRG